jgi:hypothetical protein
MLLWVAVFKRKKSIQISELFIYQMLKAGAWYHTAVNQNI